MTYVSWAVLYEGASDRAYFEVLLPRVMEEMTLNHGHRISTIPNAPAIVLKRGSINEVAEEACSAIDAFLIAFIHADTGGRSLEAGVASRSASYCEEMNNKCKFPSGRCVTIKPRKETEAWLLADLDAVGKALGYTDSLANLGLPSSPNDAEKLVDPKAALTAAVRQVRGRRRKFNANGLYGAIAQRQSLA